MSKNDYVVAMDKERIDQNRISRPDINFFYYICSECNWGSDIEPVDMSCPWCEQLPLELCDLCNELESPRYFLYENGLKYCASAEDYYWEQYNINEVFVVGDRRFKFIYLDDKNQLIEVTEIDHVQT